MDNADPFNSDIFHPGGRLRLELFDETAITVLREMIGFTRSTNWDSVRTPHLFMGLLASPDDGIRNWGRRLRTDLPCLLEQFCDLFYQNVDDPDAIIVLNREFLSDNVIHLLRQAHHRCQQGNRSKILPIDLLICLFTTPGSIVAGCFEQIGMTAAKLTELAVMAELTTSKS
ncbi:hypothetical protein [Tuwongella immobilis]|uniref:Clp R domain-containing protein n=1 Tax=Tuwongella immobilis TaxID=692036 RepID=A0A6C2YJZ5_9BACT|nr:hypothetical protein [Tuwongella immobilis]VIP01898.1 unnamed protein product [Tuwongella immobilis]VTR99782.1 unnamed protein product [Tuwongella immobilis]